MLSGSTWVYSLVSRLGFLVSPRWGRVWVIWFLPAGGEDGLFWFLPIGREGGWFGYFRLGERVMFFPLGGLVLWLLLLGGDGYGLPAGEVGFMVTPCWGRGWVRWLWSSYWGSWFHGTPCWGEGGLLGYSPLGQRVGCMVTPHWGRGLTICKVNSCFVCSNAVLDFFG